MKFLVILGIMSFGFSAFAQISVRETDENISLYNGEKVILSYQKAVYPAPAGRSELYQRSGFVHPLNSPAGATLTRIQPPDHYHHYGIWNPWTRVLVEADTVDFWNIADGQGTVRYQNTKKIKKNSFTVLQEHVVLLHDSEKVVLNEEITISAKKDDGKYVIDHNSVYRVQGEIPFHILAYRYQGFGFRARKSWNEENIRMLTSEGLDLDSANFSRGNWILVEGPVGNNQSAGILFMGHKQNYNAPQLFRVWPRGSNEGQENIFINFNPAQDVDWVMEPGVKYQLNYRIVVYDGRIEQKVAEDLWMEYAK